jgi:hypothetical protein
LIEISIENVDIFHYISKIIHNTFLEDCCHLVTSTHSQFFFFTSEHFRDNSSLELINDFKIKTKIKSLELNSKYSSLISRKILNTIQLKHNHREIDFSIFEEANILIAFFNLLKGIPFDLSQFNLNLVLKATDFLQFDFFQIETKLSLHYNQLIYHQILSNNALTFSNYQQNSSTFFSQNKEKDLFPLFALLNAKSFIFQLIDNLQLSDNSQATFIHLKKCFKNYFLLSGEVKTQ